MIHLIYILYIHNADQELKYSDHGNWTYNRGIHSLNYGKQATYYSCILYTYQLTICIQEPGLIVCLFSHPAPTNRAQAISDYDWVNRVVDQVTWSIMRFPKWSMISNINYFRLCKCWFQLHDLSWSRTWQTCIFKYLNQGYFAIQNTVISNIYFIVYNVTCGQSASCMGCTSCQIAN